MVNRNWGFGEGYGDGFGSGYGSGYGSGMSPQNLPGQVAPTRYETPRVSPTRQYVQQNMANTVVPHIHPSHLTTVNNQCIHHQHYFPHTQSVQNHCNEQHIMCGTPFNPWGSRRNKHRGC